MKSIGLCCHLVERLAEQNITTPTSIQQIVIPRILSGDSLVVRSQTGSGKTLAYLLPLVQRMMAEADGSQLLVLLPTRELAQQVGRVCEMCDSGLSVAVIYGGVEYDGQREALVADPRIIIATPGRLQDLIAQGVAKLDRVCYFVLDEVDQMVDMGFRDSIVELSQLRQADTQTLCFSATLSDAVADIVGGVDVVELDGQPLAAQRIEQSGYFVEQSMMDQLLLHLLRTKSPRRAILFCRSRKMADRLAQLLVASEFAAEAIHSERSQAARDHIMRRFNSGETRYLVATDLVARGIDVDDVSHIFNFGLPLSPDQYVHRIGRTGRAGASGEAITLLCPDENRLLQETCAHMRQPISIVASHPYLTPAVTRALQNEPKQKRRSRR